MAKRPIEHNKSAFVNKKLEIDLKIKKIATEIYETKKEGIKEILKVSLVCPESGLTIVIKGKKATHELRDYDKRMLNTKENIHLTLSLPSIRQTAITENFSESGESEE
ncbi:hypothetical protein LCGC14_1270900 [marine sediment metagenome]|uniref:Uncharacterized protein n=1 Tax=marine sediment metagenome TaxID=412755 RepID=A0A0F9P154_9ZZZZ